MNVWITNTLGFVWTVMWSESVQGVDLGENYLVRRGYIKMLDQLIAFDRALYQRPDLRAAPTCQIRYIKTTWLKHIQTLIKCRVGSDVSFLHLKLNSQKFFTFFSLPPLHELQLGTLMEISSSTPSPEPYPPHVASTGRRGLNIFWRWWPLIEAALLSAQLSQWKSKCWMSMTTALSSAKLAIQWTC